MANHIRVNNDYFHHAHDLYLPPTDVIDEKGQEVVCGERLDTYPYYQCTRSPNHGQEDHAAHGVKYNRMFARWKVQSQDNKEDK